MRLLVSLEVDGVGRGIKYLLSSMFDFENSSHIYDGDNIVNDVKLKDNEIKILNYVIKNGYINNLISKSELGLEKYKSVRLFNSLIKKEKTKKEGSGNKIRYVLKWLKCNV